MNYELLNLIFSHGLLRRGSEKVAVSVGYQLAKAKASVAYVHIAF